VAERSKCLICKSAPADAPYYEGAAWRVLRCRACSFAWVAETSEAPASTAFDWDEDIVAESARRSPMYEDRIRRVESHQPVSRSWLDVGCGGGGLLRCVVARGYRAEGLELSPSGDRVAQALGIPVHRRPLKTVTRALRLGPFGVVSYFHVLEHVHDPLDELLTASEVIAADGLLVVEVPHFDTILWRIFGSRHRHFYPGHLSYFNRRSLCVLLDKAGFLVERIESVPYVMTVSWALRRLAGPAARLPRLLPGIVGNRRISVNSGEYLLAVARRGRPVACATAARAIDPRAPEKPRVR
jgi:SAM-dependent methyltransferase